MQASAGIEDCEDGMSVHPPIGTILDALTFRLARLAAVNHHTGSARFREAFGLSLNEWRVMGVVNALSPVTFGRIRDVLLMDKGQLSRVVKQLTARGVLRSTPTPKDARAVELSLTEVGSELHDEVLKITALRNEVVVETLTREECQEFMRILQKITAHNEQLSELAGLLK